MLLVQVFTSQGCQRRRMKTDGSPLEERPPGNGLKQTGNFEQLEERNSKLKRLGADRLADGIVPRHKIVLASFSDIRGGASKAAYQVFRALARRIDSVEFVVAEKKTKDEHVRGPSSIESWSHKALRVLARGLQCMQWSKNEAKHSLNLFSSSHVKNSLQTADLVHLNWVNNDTLSIESLADIKAPMVITMHDEWLYCGTEHCALPHSRRPFEGYTTANKDVSFLDLDRLTWIRKRRTLEKVRNRVVFTGPSRWIVERARKSALLRRRDVRRVPNIVDSATFRRREDWGSLGELKREGKRILLSGAVGGISNPLKGFDVLRRALEALPAECLHDTVLATFGERKGRTVNIAGLRHIALGFIDSADDLARIYSAAYCTVVPSLVESFGLIAAESLACETPVVCFDSSGLTDIVQHGESGYLAEPFEATSLCLGIERLLKFPESKIREMGIAGRRHVLDNFSEKVVVEKLLAIYGDLLEDSDHRPLAQASSNPENPP